MVLKGPVDVCEDTAMNHISHRLGALLAQRGISDTDYNGEIVAVADAVIYAKNKLRTRARRDHWMSGTKFVVNIGTKKVGAMVGGTAGASAGTAVAGPVGAGVGGFAGAQAGKKVGKVVGNMAVNSVGRLGRGAKALYKIYHGTRGVNRERAARVLLHGYRDHLFQPMVDDLAPQALDAIFDGEEWRQRVNDYIATDTLDTATPIVAKRLKSTTNKFFG